MPNLLEIQKDSYKWFIEEGLHEVFKDVASDRLCDYIDISGSLTHEHHVIKVGDRLGICWVQLVC